MPPSIQYISILQLRESVMVISVCKLFFVKWNLGGNCVRVRHVTSSSTTSSRGREMKFSERLWKFVKVESESCDKSSARAIQKFLHTRNVNISIIQVCQMLGGFLLSISKGLKKTKKWSKYGKNSTRHGSRLP